VSVEDRGKEATQLCS